MDVEWKMIYYLYSSLATHRDKKNLNGEMKPLQFFTFFSIRNFQFDMIKEIHAQLYVCLTGTKKCKKVIYSILSMQKCFEAMNAQIPLKIERMVNHHQRTGYSMCIFLMVSLVRYSIEATISVSFCHQHY